MVDKMWIFYSLLIFLLRSSVTYSSATWRWECVSNNCEKKLVTPDTEKSALSLSACRIFCTDNAALWPKPTEKLILGNFLVHLNTDNIHILIGKPDSPAGALIQECEQVFKTNIDAIKPTFPIQPQGRSLSIFITLKNYELTDISLDTDESYILQIKENIDKEINANITASNYFGSRHALETLSQLIIYDDIRNEIQIVGDVYIKDEPVYSHRGILLDTARNFFSVESIMRTLDGMASTKLNVLHWHITDSSSFPFYSKSNPNLSRLGAYEPSKVYMPEDIKMIIDYARVRGIRILPEFDAPAHVGEGWQDTGLVVCLNAQPWKDYCAGPPCGQLDPTQPKLYDVLESIYGDMIELFKPDMFHMGGDEVYVNCWNSTKNIVEWMEETQQWGNTEEDFMKLWGFFQKQALERLIKKNGKSLPAIVWTSKLTSPNYVEKYLPKDQYIIQVWTSSYNPVIKSLLSRDYRLILSNYDALYLDCGFESWTGGTTTNNWCSPYIGWQKVYDNSPLRIARSPENKKNILGAEAALWSEQIDERTIDSRLWPRAAALGERLWAEPLTRWRDAEKRILIHRQRLVKRGIAASAMQPEWCLQNQDNCPSK